MAYSEMSYAEVSQDPDQDVPFNARKRRFFGGHRVGLLGSTGLFIGTAVASGLLCFIIFNLVFGFSHRPPPHWRPRPHPSPEHANDALSTSFSDLPHNYTHGRPEAPELDYHELDLEDMQAMVARTQGYFVRDWSLALGWNNMRYIIEAAYTQAEVLNRTLVVPSFVYARACEYELDACADYATMVNKGEAIGSDQWNDLPYELQMGFRIPIQYMLNVTRLRSRHPVLTVAQYLRLHNLPPEAELTSGAWDREGYHVHASALEEDQAQRPSLFVIENHWYDPWQATRVDRVPDDMKARGKWSPEGGDSGLGERGHWPETEPNAVDQHLREGLGERSMTHEWDRAVELLKETDAGSSHNLDSDESIIAAFQNNGWEVLYTFKSVLNMEFTRFVVEPTRQVVPRTSVRGWADEYATLKEDVVLLVGEVHIGRKPGGFRFTTPEARSSLEDLVLHYVVPIDAMYALAEKLAARMRTFVDGRLWMGTHMRRGDFVREGWVMEKDPKDHVDRVKDRLAKGREILASLEDPHAYPLPNVKVSEDLLTLEPPRPDDKFYAATDERDPAALKVIADNGAIFLDDLLTMSDRRVFGWPLMITDVRAILEQTLLAHSAYFYAHAMSSVAGGVVNMRAAFGADPRTVLID